MSRVTVEGTLPVGILVEGKLHRGYELRNATVGDNIEVTDELEAAGESLTPLRVGTAMMARQLVSLGTLRREQITTALVRSLPTADWNHLDRESEALEKKLLSGGQTPSLDGGSTSSPGASDTVSTPSKSDTSA